MISVLRKVSQLNIKHKKNGDPIVDVCTGAPSDEVKALVLGYQNVKNVDINQGIKLLI